MHRSLILFASVLCVLHFGCSGDASDSGEEGGNQSPSADASENLDGNALGASERDLSSSQSSDGESGAGDMTGGEGEGEGEGEAPPCDGCFGDPCEGNEECDSGWCVEGPDGRICTDLCIEDCPEGFECRQVQSSGGDPVFICVYTQVSYCRPCMKDGDCNDALLGGQDNLCFSQDPAEGSFCATPCASKEDCPEGGSCKTIDYKGVSRQLCMPESKTCECSQRAINEQATTLCFQGNSFGTCEGQRSCSDSGLSPCTAPAAASEVCNDIDEDCDGNTDEDFPEKGLPCDGPDLGICAAGTFTCSEDALICDEPPAPNKSCDDGDPCTQDVLVEDPETCAYSCQHQILVNCCGNGLIEEGESCDGACPEICNDDLSCTADSMIGAPETCNVQCVYEDLPDPGTDTDGDTLTNCEEERDEHPFTHPYVFNGLTAIIGESPEGFFTSAECDLFFGANYGAMFENFVNSGQKQNIWSGWEYQAGNTNNYADSSEFDFEPNWDNSDNTGAWGSFQILFRGRIHVSESGTHCFSVDTGAGGMGPGDIAGRRNSCGRVYINANSATTPIAETGYGSAESPATGCVTLEAGSHTIDLAARHYESYFYSPKFLVRYCFGDEDACTPNEPLMAHQLQAENACAPNCANADCGADLCGFVCGHCSDTSVCGEDGLCAPLCTAFCGDKECGSDGCGGSCGACADGSACSIEGVCLGECESQCEDKSCGPDGCGGSCGECEDGDYCKQGTCAPVCEADCSTKECGSDGCGGSCGTCDSGETCNAEGQCAASCVKDCAGKSCGPDGCGGQCGLCGEGQECGNTGQCESPGACINASDSAVLGQYSDAQFTDLSTDCGVDCAFNSNAEKCISECYQDIGLSKGCADCYGAVGACAKSNCAFKCFDPSSQGCLDCVKDAGCEDNLATCTGIQ